MAKFFFIFFVHIFIFLNCIAQYDEDERVKAAIWDPKDTDFAVTKYEERWKNESAVILCKKYEYRVQKALLTNDIYEEIITHTRILLNDKAAVNEFSTFKFDISHDMGIFFGYNNYSTSIGIKVVKPDGTVKEVKVDESLIDEINSRRSQRQIQKVAVPGLEPGDILDYFFASSNNLYVRGFYPFSPIIYPLVDDYPIMKHKIEMHIMRRCYLNARSMNGSPELGLQEDSKRRDMVYTITDINRDKIKKQPWLYPLRELPVLIFQAYFINSPFAKNNYCFYDNEDVIKKNVTDGELLEFVNCHMATKRDKAVKQINKYLHKYYKEVTDPKVLAGEVFYFYRQYIYAQNYQTDMLLNHFKIAPPNDFTFIHTLSEVFTQLKIKHSVIASIPREIGSINDLIMPSQIGYLLRLDVDTPIYFSNFTRNSLIGELDDSYQGNECKAVTILLPEKNRISGSIIPIKQYTGNGLKSISDITFDPVYAEKISISRNISVIGLEKNKYQSILLIPDDYIKAYKDGRYGITSKTENDESQKQHFVQINAQEINQREEYINKRLKKEFDVSDVKVKKIEVLQPGIWEDAPELKFADNFELKKYINKIGNNIILDAGMLIGEQIMPEALDTIRKYNVYLPYACIYEKTVSIEIPKGYLAKGIDKFNYNVTNETGGFLSSAKLEGNKIIIKTTEYFTSNYFPKGSWSKLLAFLNTASDFKHEKVMFVPIK